MHDAAAQSLSPPADAKAALLVDAAFVPAPHASPCAGGAGGNPPDPHLALGQLARHALRPALARRERRALPHLRRGRPYALPARNRVGRRRRRAARRSTPITQCTDPARVRRRAIFYLRAAVRARQPPTHPPRGPAVRLHARSLALRAPRALFRASRALPLSPLHAHNTSHTPPTIAALARRRRPAPTHSPPPDTRSLPPLQRRRSGRARRLCSRPARRRWRVARASTPITQCTDPARVRRRAIFYLRAAVRARQPPTHPPRGPAVRLHARSLALRAPRALFRASRALPLSPLHAHNTSHTPPTIAALARRRRPAPTHSPPPDTRSLPPLQRRRSGRARRLCSRPARVAPRGRRRGETPRTPAMPAVASPGTRFARNSPRPTRARTERLHTQPSRRRRPRRPRASESPCQLENGQEACSGPASLAPGPHDVQSGCPCRLLAGRRRGPPAVAAIGGARARRPRSRTSCSRARNSLQILPRCCALQRSTRKRK